MVQASDDRLVSLDVQLVGANGQPEGDIFTFDQRYYIIATGTKFTDGSLGECAVRVDNIGRSTRDFLVSKTSPWVVPRLYANISLSVGRKSKGTFLLFTGQATASNPSQPPDIGLTFTSLTMSALLGNIGSLNGGPMTTLKSLAEQIAAQLPNPAGGIGIPLEYQATYNPFIANYSFTGPLIRQIDKLNTMGGINAFVDNNHLIVVDNAAPRTGSPVILNSATGMIGVPEVNELGVTARMLIQQEVRPCDKVTVQSKLNPAANGNFFVYKLGFEIASRALPFYFNLDMRANLLGATP